MEKEAVGFNKQTVKAILFGTITSILSSIVFLVLFSVFMTIQRMPSDGGFYLSFVIVSLSAFFGGFFGAKISGSRGLMVGALSGFLYILLVALIGGASGFAVNLFGTFLLKTLLSALFGGIGGVVQINLRRR